MSRQPRRDATIVQNINGWNLERTLGSGGFGAVHLFRNEMTGQYIAVKQCRQGDELTDKNKSRWSLECQIMLQLQHPNLVRGLPLPEELSILASGDLPVLAMEFCELGDLRKVLNRPENCQGLPEFQVRTITRDIASAVEFLHQKRVIHRDLKPENVVMQKGDNRVVYKLIDLGYAKDLTKDSVCTSFVGTLQYLAPELFVNGNPKYTCTVDFWSLGNTVFECITGFRPFLHSQPPIKWLQAVSSKKPSHIGAFINERNEIEYFEKLPKPNHLCSLSQTYFEQWLRIMLLYDPQHRGGDIVGKGETQRRQCFELLDRIMKMKLIHIYSVVTNEVLSYPAEIDSGGVTRPMPLDSIATMIRGTTGIDPPNQELLTLTGSVADFSKDVANYSAQLEESLEKDRIDLFLFSRRNHDFPPEQRHMRPMPRQVQMILEHSDKENIYSDQVDTCKYVIYYCTQVSKDFGRLLEAHRAANMCLMREKSMFSASITQLKNDCSELTAKIEMFDMSVQTDLAELLNQQKTTGTFSKKMYDAWEARRTEVLQFSSLIDEMMQLEGDCESISSKVLEVQRSPFSKENVPLRLQMFQDIARKIYEDLRSLPHDMRHKASKTLEMVQCVQECMKESNQLTRDLYTHLSKVLRYKAEMQRLKLSARALQEKVNQDKDSILKHQKQRQKEIWKLLSTVTSQVAKRSVMASPTNPMNGGEPFMPEQNTRDSLTLREESSDVRQRLEELVSLMSIDSGNQKPYDWSFLSHK